MVNLFKRRTLKISIIGSFTLLIALFFLPWKVNNYMHIHFRKYLSSVQSLQQQPPEKSHYLSCPPNLEFHQVYEGHWRMKTHIDENRKKYIDGLITNFHKSLGVPLHKVIRKDLKCGVRYPAGRGDKIPTHCDGNGEKPCCNENTGLCGNTTADCDCGPVNCKDYSKEIQAEFADWVESYCPLENYNQKTTCDFLSKHFSSVTIAGDSQTRHIFQSAAIHLTGDSMYGSLKSSLPPKQRESFKDEVQFYHVYYPHIVPWSDMQNRSTYCNESSKKVRIEFLQLQRWSHLKQYLANFKARLAEGKPLFIFGIGLWDNFVWDKISEKFMIPMFEFLNSYNGTHKPVSIWLGGNAHGAWKQARYIKMQGDWLTVPFNKKVMKLCAEYGIPYFDNFSFTFNTVSQDGTHYASGVNNVKFKMLMKLAKYLIENEKRL